MRRQRFWVHKTANVLNALPEARQRNAKQDLHQMRSTGAVVELGCARVGMSGEVFHVLHRNALVEKVGDDHGAEAEAVYGDEAGEAGCSNAALEHGAECPGLKGCVAESGGGVAGDDAEQWRVRGLVAELRGGRRGRRGPGVRRKKSCRFEPTSSRDLGEGHAATMRLYGSGSTGRREYEGIHPQNRPRFRSETIRRIFFRILSVEDRP